MWLYRAHPGNPRQMRRRRPLSSANRTPQPDGLRLQLNAFIGGDVPSRRPVGAPSAGLLMVSFFVDVEATLERLAELGMGGAPRRVTQSTPTGQILVATVRDPDGVLVLLTAGSITQAHGGRTTNDT
jgi:hypothetical protein